ncbi:hypothetical protein Pme01_21510 [Planosporangium mesophilum]|uniref:Uncharacterized protein n=2 Tax=Planosporangium mesophilum TaxID=689768 RepID=A0A8J3TA72_9ACTN|nr:hypothetical protein Pme01_21510 [Planosporangium mesophilum]
MRPYRGAVINPGTLPVDGATEAAAAQNMTVFITAVLEQGGQLAGDPVRDPEADRDGRFGYLLPVTSGSTVRVLMPGVDLQRVRDDLTVAAPCLYVDDEPWWWPSAVTQAVGATARLAVAELTGQTED